MKTFYQMLEAMQPISYDVAFLDVSDKSPSLDSIMTSIHFNSYSYIIDYMISKGLFMGKEPKLENLYPKKCKKYSNAPFVSTTPKEGVNTTVFADKIFENCFLAEENEDGSKTIQLVDAPMMHLVKSYCRRATEIRNFKYLLYFADLENGLRCIVDDVLSSFHTISKQKLGSYKGAPTGIIVWKFEGDNSLEERITLTKDFDPVYNKLPITRPGMPLRLFYPESIEPLHKTVLEIKASMQPNDPNFDNITDFLRMIETAKRKGVGVLVKPNLRLGTH